MEKELPKRKPLRLRNFDYSAPGLYFITICTHRKKATLSRVVGAIHGSPEKRDDLPACDAALYHSVGAIHESPEIKLTAYGKIVDKEIQALSERFAVVVEQYVIMPNHVHLLLTITDDTQMRALREAPLRSRSEMSKIVGYLKMNASKEIHRQFGEEAVWQRGFHDHIIRDREDHGKHLRYIAENPFYWHTDELYVGA